MSNINFPISPVSGQTHSFGDYNYVFDGVKWTSVVKFGVAASKIQSSTAPSTPEAGLQWYDDESGRTYFWHVNYGSSDGQWVEDSPQSDKTIPYATTEEVGSVLLSTQTQVNGGLGSGMVSADQLGLLLVGLEQWCMVVKPGYLHENGQMLERSAYPNLWNWAVENSLVLTDADWLNRGASGGSVCYFSHGNGSTTFRMPRVSDFIRPITSTNGRWPGQFQDHSIQTHAHNYNDTGAQVITGTGRIGVANSQSYLRDTVRSTYAAGSSETRPKNISKYFIIKY